MISTYPPVVKRRSKCFSVCVRQSHLDTNGHCAGDSRTTHDLLCQHSETIVPVHGVVQHAIVILMPWCAVSRTLRTAYMRQQALDSSTLRAARVRSSLVTRQRFYAGYIKRVNTELDSWLSPMLPSQFVHVALQRLVVRGTLLVLPPPADETDEVVAPHDVGESRLQILGSATMADQALVAANTSTKLPTSIHMHIASRLRSACFQETVRPLLHVLGLENDATAWNATHRFLLASLPTVLQSVATQSARPLLLPQSDSSFSWPHTMQPHAVPRHSQWSLEHTHQGGCTF